MTKKNEVYLVEDSNQPLLVEGQSAPILVEEQPSPVLAEGTSSTSDKTKRGKSSGEIETAESRAQEALRKMENAAEKRTKSASEQIPAQEVSVTNIANFANATRYLKELERNFEEITKSTKGQKAIWNKMANVLNTVPIPTVKEELFTFAVSMHSKMSERLGGEGESVREAGAMLMTAYLSKYKECILKVKSLYPTDPVFANLLSTYEEDIKKAKSAIWWQRDHESLWWTLFSIGTFALMGLLGLLGVID